MRTFNVTVPSKLKAQIDRRIAEGEFSSAEQYVQDLLRRDEQRRRQRGLEQQLLKRLDMSDAVEMNAADFERIRQRIRRRIKSARAA